MALAARAATAPTPAAVIVRRGLIFGCLCFAISIGWAMIALLIYGIDPRSLGEGLARVLTLAELDSHLMLTSLVIAPLAETAALVLLAMAVSQLRFLPWRQGVVLGLVLAFALGMLLHGGRLPDVGRSVAFAVLYYLIVDGRRVSSWLTGALTGGLAHLVWNGLGLLAMYIAHAVAAGPR